MSFIENIILGLSVATSFENLFYCLVGAVVGTAIGVLPGVGPLATMSMLLPLTFGMSPTAALIMLAGIYYGSQYGGSTTAILINLPGESSSVVTTLDGHQMARQGRAGAALAAAALGSFFAGTVATLLIALLATPLTKVGLQFGSPEYFSLICVGLLSSMVISSKSALRSIGMICLGVLLGTTGIDLYTGMPRFVFGQQALMEGLNFVAVAVGIFGIAEIIRNLELSDMRKISVATVGRIWPTRAELRKIVAPAIRGTTIGSFLGVLPGAGALLAPFFAYSAEKRLSRDPSRFGHGAIEGVAAPEAANNAGAQTSFIPMLSLGIPSTALMALMIGAMIMQGVVPGPNVINTNPDLFWGLIISMWIGNAMLLVLNLPMIGVWVSMVRAPYDMLFPAIVAFCCIGVFSISNASFDVYLVMLAGVVGYVLVKLECELTPLILGLLLGPMLEEHLRRSLILSSGDFSIFIQRPISLLFLVLCAVIFVLLLLPIIAPKKTAEMREAIEE